VFLCALRSTTRPAGAGWVVGFSAAPVKRVALCSVTDLKSWASASSSLIAPVNTFSSHQGLSWPVKSALPLSFPRFFPPLLQAGIWLTEGLAFHISNAVKAFFSFFFFF